MPMKVILLAAMIVFLVVVVLPFIVVLEQNGREGLNEGVEWGENLSKRFNGSKNARKTAE